ncbi:MAG: hypothetical protein RR971_04105 [Alistipes sp.]
MIDVKFKGYEDGIKVVAQLPVLMQQKMLRRALRASAKPMLTSARERVPRRTGLLSKMLRIVNLRRNRSRPSEVAVAVKPVWSIGKKSGKINQYYGKFIHDGTRDRKPRVAKTLKFEGSNGAIIFPRKSRGVKSTPFLLDAYNANAQTVIDNFGQVLAQEVGIFVNKNFKKIE